MDVQIPPSVPCPTCGKIIVVSDDMCWSCERMFANPRELWERYEAMTDDWLQARSIDHP